MTSAVRTGFRGLAAIRSAGLLGAIALLAVVAVSSVVVGARDVPLDTVVDALWNAPDTADATVVRELRVPRTVLGISVGAALGMAGALMQALTRNPLADPGLLGVTAGASAAIVLAIAWLGIGSVIGYVWFAFAGAAIAAAAVYVLGSRGRSTTTPVRLALAGTAVNAALLAFIQAMVMTFPEAFNEYRFWQIGAFAGRDIGVLWQVLPFLLAGILFALALARPLNALALGDDTARGLGANVGRTQVLGAVAIALLGGAATAAAGPISFVGLAVPHITRSFTGPDQRWLLPYSMVLAPVLLLGADIVGRVIARPGELEVGLVTAFLGAPVFILLARRSRLSTL